jgi:hypothetical protein
MEVTNMEILDLQGVEIAEMESDLITASFQSDHC